MEGGARSREGGREPATALISATPPHSSSGKVAIDAETAYRR